MKKIMAFLIIGGLLLSGCGGTASQKPVNKKPVKSDIEFEIINTHEEEFKTNRELNKWYSQNYQVKGIYKMNSQGRTYILVSAGQRTTGGYNMEIVDLTANDTVITIATKLNEPQPDQMTTMVITYPHLLIAIPEDNRNVIWNDETGNK